LSPSLLLLLLLFHSDMSEQIDITAQSKAFLAHMNKSRQCAQCNATFKLGENIGQYKCRRHTGIWRYGNAVWSCCGADFPEAYGCVGADHSDQAHFSAPLAIAVPRVFIDHGYVMKPSVDEFVYAASERYSAELRKMLRLFEHTGLTVQEKNAISAESVVVECTLPRGWKPQQ
jgi:hypothetical protein